MFRCVVIVALGWGAACTDVDLFPIVEETPVEEGPSGGVFCAPEAATQVSRYTLGDLFVVNTTVTKVGGRLVVDHDSNGVDDAQAALNEASPTVTIDPSEQSGDGLPDTIEVLRGLSVGRQDALEDADLDGLVNKREVQQMTDPFYAGDRAEVVYAVKPAERPEEGCGAGQPAYAFDVTRLALMQTPPFVDPVNRDALSLSHARDENVVLVLARLVPTLVSKDDLLLAALFRQHATQPAVVRLAPQQFVALAHHAPPSCTEGCEPQLSDLGNSYRRVAVGKRHSCAISTTGAVYCWGDATAGALGTGDTQARMVPTAVELPSRASAIVSGDEHVCVLDVDGRVYCWGSNLYGQLGSRSNLTAALTPEPVDLVADARAVHLSAGSHHTCASFADQSLRCWGRNDGRQLGDGTDIDRARPVSVLAAGGEPVALAVEQLSSGGGHSCAVDASGRGYCWGEVGLPRRRTTCAEELLQALPTELTGSSSCTRAESFPARGTLPRSWNQIVTNGVANYGVAQPRYGTVGRATCWQQPDIVRDGYAAHDYGCGLNQTNDIWTQGLSHVVTISLGATHACAIYQEIEGYGREREVTPVLSCWGNTAFGQTGVPPDSDSPVDPIPTVLPQVERPIDVASGTSHTCAIDGNGSLWCWGANDYGQSGTGHVADLVSPTRVTGQ
jgi:alpha-tubulin suppressor-like RCC1 family protein